MLSMTLKPSALSYGALEVPYANVVGAGVGVSVRRTQTVRYILVAYRPSSNAPARLLSLRLRPGDQGFAEQLRAVVPDRWVGESTFFDVRKRLGFSNRRVVLIVALLTALVVVGVVLALTLGAKR